MVKILVVEDDTLLSDAYKLILTRKGHEVATAYNGKEALDVAKKFEPNIILLDILMPKMNGLEFLEQYDVLKKHPNVTVVIMSNLEQTAEVQRAMSLGAYKYIVKANTSANDLSVLINHLISKNLDKKTAKS